MRTRTPPGDLAGFPTTPWPAGHEAHRVYRPTDPATGRPRTPLFFASAPSDPHRGGRYDLSAPDGSCYLADDVHTCVLEVVADDLAPGRGRQLLADPALRSRRRVALTADADTGPFADLDAPAAHGYGIAGDVHATDDRAATQRWADALHGHGHLGVRGHARTPPSGTAGTWTLFGPAGPADAPPGRLASLRVSAPTTLHDDRDLLAELAAHGVDVLPVPNDVDAD